MAWGFLLSYASGLDPAFRTEPVKRPLRHHCSTVLLTIAYIVLLVLPWVATCILNVRPTLTGTSSYTANPAVDLVDGAEPILRWIYAIKVMTALNGVLAIPLVSAVLAHAAVAFVQRRQTLHPIELRHFLSLSDASWMRIPGRERYRSKFVLAATALVLLSLIVPAFQYALVSVETIQVVSCADLPYVAPKDFSTKCWEMSEDSQAYTTIGFDPEPAAMASAPAALVMQRVANNLATANLYDRQIYAWTNSSGSAAGTFNEYYEGSQDGEDSSFQTITPVPYFVSALPKGTATGVLREHAIRMNSTAHCDVVAASTYPTVCSGGNPFTGIYSVADLTIRFCLPGNYATVPWSNSRDLETIVENLYIDIQVYNATALQDLDGSDSYANMTINCVATSSRGYFELPNIWNDNTPGPLLETWPTQQELEDNFNDYTIDGEIPSTESSSYGDIVWPTLPYEDTYHATGPLTIATMAMLGNASSWFPAAVSAASSTDANVQRDALYTICNYHIPLGLLDSYYGFGQATVICDDIDLMMSREGTAAVDLITEIVYDWFAAFGTSEFSGEENEALLAGDEGLGVAMYFANEALLTGTAAVGSLGFGGSREVFVASGMTITKPKMSNWAEIVISVLLGIEVLALLGLLGYIYFVPTIGSRFDAATLLVIGARLKDALGSSLPRLGLVDKKALTRLEDIDVREAFLLDGGTGIELEDRQPRSDEEMAGDGSRCSEDTVVDPHAPARRRD